MTADEIINAVAEVYGMSTDMLRSERCRPYTEARQMAIYICSRYILASNSSTLAEIFHRSRSTILHSVFAAKCLLATNWAFYERYKAYKKKLQILDL